MSLPKRTFGMTVNLHMQRGAPARYEDDMSELTDDILLDYIDEHSRCGDQHHCRDEDKCCVACGYPWPCPTVDLGDEVRRLRAERDAALKRVEEWTKRALTSANERNIARQRAERLLAGLREIEFGMLDPSDYPDPNACWCYYCEGMPPTHQSWCRLAALIREAEGA